jgi:serine/threonine protein kinase
VDEEGFVTGSVYYLAPEQMEGREMDVRSNLCSLGCLGYFALCARNPFVGATVADVINAHLQHTIVPLQTLRPDLPAALCVWVERMLARNPEDCPPSAAAALEELQAAFYRRSGSWRPSIGTPSREDANANGRRFADQETGSRF